MVTAAAKGPTLSRQVGLDWVVVLVCLIIFPTAQMFFLFSFFFLLLFHINTERMGWWRWVQLLSTHWTKVRFGQKVSSDISINLFYSHSKNAKIGQESPYSAFKCNFFNLKAFIDNFKCNDCSTFGEQVHSTHFKHSSFKGQCSLYLFLLKRN